MSVGSQLKSVTSGFGLERLGLLSLRYPKAMLVFVALVFVGSVACALNLQFESDTRGLFRSKSQFYANFDESLTLYPGQVNQVLVVVEGGALQTADGLEKLRMLHQELGIADSVDRVVSLFSARSAPVSAQDNGDPFVPDPLDASVDIEVLRTAISDHPVVKNKLLSRDGKTALLIVTLDVGVQNIDQTTVAIAEIDTAADEILEGTGLTIASTGLPVVRTEVIRSLKRDQLIFIAAGIAIGLFFSYMFFRRLKYVIITEIPVIISNAGLLGGMWLAGQKVNVLSGMVTPLISVISLASALHLTFAIRRAHESDPDLKSAIRTAVIETGPGCVLSSLTTALALLALTIAPYPVIESFGIVAVIGALFALFATLLTLPATAYLILKRWPPTGSDKPSGGPLAVVVEAICWTSAKAVERAPWVLTFIGILLVAVMGTAYLQNKPRYTSLENLPATSTAVETIKLVDSRLAGSSHIRVLLKWPGDGEFPDVDALKAVADADKILASQPWITSVWSLGDVVRWAHSGGLSEQDGVQVVRNIKDELSGQVLTQTPNTALLTGYFPNTNARALIPRLDALEVELDGFRARWPQIVATLTGVSALEAVTSSNMINTLNWSLLSAIGLIILLITIALRSVRAGLVSVIPNLFPIAAAGTYLYVTDQGLQFTSVIAFTIGFGMAVDSTIHYLNHYNLAKSNGLSTREAVSKTTLSVGPVLVVTTLIVAAGLGATLLSDLPLVKLYGQISILVLLVALVADLVFLPAIISVVDR